MRAVKVCCGRCCHACETPVEYAWRRRKTDMADILALAIDRELTVREREVTEDYWLSGMSFAEIAESRNISRASVGAAKSRAEKKLKKALCYLKVYLSELPAEPDDISIEPEAAILAARAARGGDIGSRIGNLRISRALPRAKASAVTGINERRLEKIECGSVLPDAGEIVRICSAYGVSYEELLG